MKNRLRALARLEAVQEAARDRNLAQSARLDGERAALAQREAELLAGLGSSSPWQDLLVAATARRLQALSRESSALAGESDRLRGVALGHAGRAQAAERLLSRLRAVQRQSDERAESAALLERLADQPRTRRSD